MQGPSSERRPSWSSRQAERGALRVAVRRIVRSTVRRNRGQSNLERTILELCAEMPRAEAARADRGLLINQVTDHVVDQMLADYRRGRRAAVTCGLSLDESAA